MATKARKAKQVEHSRPKMDKAPEKYRKIASTAALALISLNREAGKPLNLVALMTYSLTMEAHDQTDGNRSDMALVLGENRRTIQRRLHVYGVKAVPMAQRVRSLLAKREANKAAKAKAKR